jgi:hypothetical protein
MMVARICLNSGYKPDPFKAKHVLYSMKNSIIGVARTRRNSEKRTYSNRFSANHVTERPVPNW